MFKDILLYIGAALPGLWGISHLFPTVSVVKGFGEISADNKHIITMEWITEGVALIFIGLLITLITVIDPSSSVSRAVYLLTAICMLALAAVSLFTGFKIDFLPFRLCPVIFTGSALCIFLGGLILR